MEMDYSQFVMDKDKEEAKEERNRITEKKNYNTSFIIGEDEEGRTLVEVSDDEPVFAQQISFAGRPPEYSILCDSLGNIFDPYDVMMDKNNYDEDRGKPRWELKNVPEEVYKLYLKYLKTQNETYLRIVDRDVRNLGI